MRENKNNKINLKKLVHTSTVHLLVYSLISVHSPAFAQQATQAKNDPHWVDGVLGLTKMVTGQVAQYQNQTAIAQRQASLMQQFKPSPRPDKMFPACQVAYAKTSFPENMCKRDLENPTEHADAQAMVQVAKQMEGFFENLLQGGQGTPLTVGKQCLEEQAKAVQTSINDRINNLQKISDTIVAQQQQFQKNNTKHIKEMTDLNRELNGGQSNDVNAKKDLSYLFKSESCKNIIGKDVLQSAGVNGGLNSILELTTAKSGEAGSYASSDRIAIENDVNNQVNKMTEIIARDGIDGWLNTVAGNPSGGVVGSTEFKGYQTVVQDRALEFNTLKDKTEKSLQELDPSYKLPAVDENFVVDFANFSSGAAEYQKKLYVNDCVTKNDSGLGFSNDQIIDLLDDSRGKSSRNFEQYRDALKEILENDSMYLEDKMQRIKQLEAQYGTHITVNYTDQTGQPAKPTTYGYLETVISACESRMATDDTFKPGSSKNVSYNKQIERAQGEIEKLQNMTRTFATDLAAELKSKIIHCEGISKKSNHCSESPFDPAGSNFCVAHADTCVNEIQGCYAQAQFEVDKRKNKLRKTASTYNKNVENLLNMQRAQLSQLANSVLADAEYLKNYFPGADYKYPQGLIIAEVQPEMSQFGVMLKGGGSLEFLENLPTQIGKLQEQLKGQAKAVEASINDHIAAQEKNLKDNYSKWGKLASDCDDKEYTYRKMVESKNMENQQNYMKAQQEANALCGQYNQLADTNPMVGCKEGDFSPDNLYADAMKSSAFLSNQVFPNINGFRTICEAYNNETSDEEEVKWSALPEACKSDSWSTIQRDIKDKALSAIPAELAEQEEDIKKYLEKENGKLPKDLEGTSFGRMLENVHATIFPTGVGSFDVTKDLNDYLPEEQKGENANNKVRDMLKKRAEKYLRDPAGKNVCYMQKNQAVLMTLNQCAEKETKGSARDCFDDNFKDNKKGLDDKEVLLQANEAIGDLQGNDLSTKWSMIGERIKHGSCMAQSSNSRNVNDPNTEALVNVLKGFNATGK